MTPRLASALLMTTLVLNLQAATFIPADSPNALASLDLQAIDALVDAPFGEAAFKKMAIVVASLARAIKGTGEQDGQMHVAARQLWPSTSDMDLENAIVSLQNQLNVIGNQTALNFAHLTQWVHGNISAIQADLGRAAHVVATKKHLKRGLKCLKKDLEAQLVANVAAEAAVRAASDALLESYIAGNATLSNIERSPLVSSGTGTVFVATTTNTTNGTNSTPTPSPFPGTATAMALLESEITSNITAMRQLIQNNYATLSNTMQDFLIGQNNINATMNSHTNQINYLNTRQDDLTSFFSNQFSGIQSSLISNISSISQYLTNSVYGKDTTNPQAHFLISRNVVGFSQGRPDPANASQLLITVPHSVSFAGAPAVSVSLLANSGAALPSYTVAVKDVNAATATIVVSLSGGAVSSSAPYSVVVFGFGN